MNREGWVKLANRLSKEAGIDLFDEEGYVDLERLKKIVTIIAEAE